MAKRIGLRAILDTKEFDQQTKSFISNINSMNSATARLAADAGRVADASRGIFGGLADSLRTVLEIATGISFRDFFSGIIRGVRILKDTVIESVTYFQRLKVQLDTLAAREYSRMGWDLAEALVHVNQQSIELIGWSRALAVTTPFSMENITMALAYGQAFGFTITQTQRMITATGEFTAAMGLTNEHFQRILYNFGQMMASGRVLGRELRDLANNMVPIMDITEDMAERAGISWQEMRELMKLGVISAEEFVAAFVDLVERDFTGAMDRMVNTLGGAKQVLRDFIFTVLGVEVFGPVFETIATKILAMVKALLHEDVLNAFAAAGYSINNAFELVHNTIMQKVLPAIGGFFSALGITIPTALDISAAILKIAIGLSALSRGFAKAVEVVTSFVNSIAKRLGTDFKDIIRNMESYGANIVIALARGMARAIIFIVNVLNEIARIITYWLKPGSPPRLLPDLEWWGQRSMQVWLDGWRLANFTVFDDIASVVTGFLQSVGTTNIPETELIPRILGARSAISEAINMVRQAGDVSEAAFQKIWSAAGISAESIKDYVRNLFELEKVTLRVNAAIKLLRFDPTMGIETKIFGESVSNLESMLKVAERFGGTLGNTLRSYVSRLFDVRDANRVLEESQKNLNDVTQKYNRILNDLRGQLNDVEDSEEDLARINKINAAIATGLLTEEEKRRLELEKARLILRRQIRDTQLERDVAVDAAKDKVDAAQEAVKEAEAAAKREKALAEEIAEVQLQAIQDQTAASKALADVQIENNRLLAKQLELLARLMSGKGVGAMELDPWDFDWEALSAAYKGAMFHSLPDLKQAIDDLQAELEKKFEDFLDELAKPFRENAFVQAITGLGTSVTTALSTIAAHPVYQWITARFWELNDGIINAMSNLDTWWTSKGDSTLERISTVIQELAENPAIARLIEAFEKLADDISTVIGNLKTFWDQNGEELMSTITGFFTRLVDELGLADLPEIGFGLIIAGIKGFGDIIVWLSEKLVEHGPTIRQAAADFVDWFFDIALPKLREIVDWIRDEAIPGLGNLARTIIDNYPAVIAILAGLLIGFLAFQALGGIVAAFSGILTVVGSVAKWLFFVKNTLGAIGAIKTLPVIGFLAANLPLIATVIGAVVAQLGLFFGILAFQFSLIKEDFGGIGTTIKAAWASTMELLAPSLEQLKIAVAGLKEAWAGFWIVLEPIVKFIGAVVIGILKVVMVALMGIGVILFSVIIGAIKGVINGIATFIKFFAEFVKGLALFFEGIKNIVVGFWEILVGIVTGSGEKIKEGVNKLMGGLILSIVGGFYAIVAFVAAIGGSLLSIIWGFITGIIGYFVGLWDKLIKKSIIKDMWNDIIDFFKDKIKQVLGMMKTWVSNIIKAIKDKASDFLNAGKNIIEKLRDGMQAIFTGSSGIFYKIVEWIGETIKKILQKLKDWKEAGKDLIKSMLEGIKFIFESATGVFATVKELVTDSIEKVKETASDWIELGKNMIEGLIEGLKAKAGDLWRSVTGIVQKALGKAEEESDTRSASKWWYNLGSDWLKGLRNAITDGTKETSDAVKKSMGRILDPDMVKGAEDFFGLLGLQPEFLNIPVKFPMQAVKDYKLLYDNLQRQLIDRGFTASPGYSSSITNVDRSVHVEVNSTYREVQSSAKVYHDVTAALATVFR